MSESLGDGDEEEDEDEENISTLGYHFSWQGGISVGAR
jgi:hypothetical protein